MKEISEHILDIANNSILADATLITIRIIEEPEKDLYTLEIEDNGCGIPKDKIEQVCDPFYSSRETRKIGMGIPLLKMNAERTGGSFSLTSEEGKGTLVKAVFKHKSVDRPAIGDISGILTIVASTDPKIDLVYIHSNQSNDYIFDTREIKTELGDILLSNPKIMRFLEDMISENLESINYTK